MREPLTGFQIRIELMDIFHRLAQDVSAPTGPREGLSEADQTTIRFTDWLMEVSAYFDQELADDDDRLSELVDYAPTRSQLEDAARQFHSRITPLLFTPSAVLDGLVHWAQENLTRPRGLEL
jgi:hypothetical protein